MENQGIRLIEFWSLCRILNKFVALQLMIDFWKTVKNNVISKNKPISFCGSTVKKQFGTTWLSECAFHVIVMIAKKKHKRSTNPELSLVVSLPVSLWSFKVIMISIYLLAGWSGRNCVGKFRKFLHLSLLCS